MDYRISQVVGRGEMRQTFDILVKNLDNLLQLLRSINVWRGNGQPGRS
jgi:hypothetical protein